MQKEILILVACVVAAIVFTMMFYRPLLKVFRVFEYFLVACSIVVIFGLMSFVATEVLMRYGFNSPIPGHLELSELLILGVVFLAISYTQRTHGHVGMDLVLDALAPATRRIAKMLALLVSIFVCAIVGWFSYKAAYQYWLYDDVTMTEPYFRTWPWAATIALGYGMTTLRMIAQFLTLLDPDDYPDDTPIDESGLHQSSD